MLCPKCSGELKIGERQGIEIDYCSACRGIWLDAGELDKIVERSGAFDRGNGQQGERESWWETIFDLFD